MALRGAIFIVPVAISATASVVFAKTFIRATGVGGLTLRFAAAFAISILVLRLSDRFARKLLPLAVLWKLSLGFPSVAPSRWWLARQAGNVKQLEEIARQAREHGIADEPTRAAEQILSLVAAVEAHDRGTRGHSERVRIYADLIAEEMRLSDEDRDKLRWASLLHDVGKLMVPAGVLNKPDKLDDEEFDLVREHPAQGMRFVGPLKAWLGEWALAIEQHHERYDGKGYPHGLGGWNIARAARIVAVADSYEVMTARRPYKRPMNAVAARKELVACAGEQFDPAIVRAFLQISTGRLRVVAGPLSWLAQTPFLRGLEQVASGAGVATTGGALALGLAPILPVVAAPPQVHAVPPAVVSAVDERWAFPGLPSPTARPPFGPSPVLPSPSPTSGRPTLEPSLTPRPTDSDSPRPTPTPTETTTARPTSSPSPTVSLSTNPKNEPTPTPSSYLRPLPTGTQQ